jgi:translation initiation factor 2B subunit (eIF-2B alpha/beta/delta family)
VGVSEREAKVMLLEEIDTFIQEKVTFADEQVARNAQSKVASGDVVLTFAFSSAVLSTFLLAKKVDSRPSLLLGRIYGPHLQPRGVGREGKGEVVAHMINTPEKGDATSM